MDDLARSLETARDDRVAMNKLVADYMPFIKSEISKPQYAGIERDDRLSVAMLVFMNCARQYDAGKGGFMAFASACIRNRLIDEGKKRRRYLEKIVPLLPEDHDTVSAEAEASKQAYDRSEERKTLAEEIDSLAAQLTAFDITLSGLADICPKQGRSRRLCAALARDVVDDPQMRDNLFRNHRLSQSALARRHHISEKTVEKHRRYIVAIAVILSGEYPGIQAFLPKGGGRQ